MPETEITLRDKGRGKIFLALRDGFVVSAMGSDPSRYIGLSEKKARHLARYGALGPASRPRIIAELWLCDDCMIFECNGDASGMEDDRYAAVLRGLERLEKSNLFPMSANFDSDTGEGLQDFSWSPCDCCGDHRGGSRHRFAVIR